MKMKLMKKALTFYQWNKLAEIRLKQIIQSPPDSRLRRLASQGKSAHRLDWRLEFKLVSKKAMIHLNKTYRGKRYPTDVLSFSTGEPFRGMDPHLGYLGELVICLPVLKEQARRLKHDPQIELDILLTHGLLHLLGLDHEQGPKEAARMARWEGKYRKSFHPINPWA